MKKYEIKMVQDCKTLTYEIGNGFRVDLQIENGVIECYLYHVQKSHKFFTLGLCENNVNSLAEAMDIFINYIENNDMIAYYKLKTFDM